MTVNPSVSTLTGKNMKYALLIFGLALVSCSSTAGDDHPDSQIYYNGRYHYTIDTPDNKIFTIKMDNGDVCYVAEEKYASRSSISCVSHTKG